VCLLLAACATSSPFDRGLAAYQAGRYADALAAFDEAIRQQPGLAPAYTNRGAARARLGDFDGARADFARALELSPRDAEVYYNRGIASVRAGVPARAVQDFSRAIELDPKSAKAYYHRGAARLLLGDRDGREDQLRAVELETDPHTKLSLQRRLGLTPSPASPPVAGTAAAGEAPAPPVTTAAVAAKPKPAPPPEVKAAPAPEAKRPTPAAPLDARALASRGLDRELTGDHEGAIADLRAALTLERDEARRAGVMSLLQLLTEPAQ
jgi:tetratricopeptide (TPR) repeat protein